LKFVKLHISGFKTFVEPTDFLIEPGLTGIVGPNGCGKSNLVEAMRWVMGENSSKNMRASGMDDVIFSGGGNRPARNMAEVGLVIDNGSRRAPAAFNDAERIEVVRRIEREQGSSYRVNGREVRARDVQLLFADAASGARSSAMVRQGQIGEIISAKPQERRRILEEAAGVAGLHSRRHEAELRLKAAEENLKRLDDVLQQIDTQAKGLERQARQAARYRTIAGEIRRCEALLGLIRHAEAAQGLAAAEQRFEAATRALTERTQVQAEAAREQALAAHALEGVHEAEAEAAENLQKLTLARETLDGEDRRAKARIAELERRIAQMKSDLARETALIADASDVLARLDAEAAELTGSGEGEAAREATAREKLAVVEAALTRSDENLAEAQAARAAVEARRHAAELALAEATKRIARLDAEIEKLVPEKDMLIASLDAEADGTSLSARLEQALEVQALLESEVAEAETRHAEARMAEGRMRAPLAEAEKRAQNLATEVKTLGKLLESGGSGLWLPVTEEISVAKGYELALGAALGDDLDASTDPAAPAHWAYTDGTDDPPLPQGAEPLSALVSGPLAIGRRLDQIGVVSRENGPELAKALKPGQRLVSKEGDLWRWDGFTQAAEAPTPAARRLAEKNRLGDLRQEAEAARLAADLRKAEAEAAHAELVAAAAAEKESRQRHRNAAQEVNTAREKSAAEDRRRAATSARIDALTATLSRLAVDRAEAAEKHVEAETGLASLDDLAALTARLDTARAAAAEDRARAGDARAELQTLLRIRDARAKRLGAIAAERQSWAQRSAGADGQIAEFEARINEAVTEHAEIVEAPDLFLMKRRELMSAIEAAEAERKSASDRRIAADSRLATADRQAKEALEAMSAAREENARAEARVEAAREHFAAALHAITAELSEEGQDPIAHLSSLANLKPGAELPPLADVEKRLESLRADRERVGAVNLRAEAELEEVQGSKSSLAAEHADLTEAIRRLRLAIQNLNKEGRERLIAAFDVVHTHFRELFVTLFGGGSAELQLIESDDPLEAGLEILARPPGKRPQVMTLLSGGEQALTAMSLIFAIFLTNPSPLCVLDEVDAPLDDANVERFCDLLAHMCGKTDTRFIAITHNPITMARMNRLFGVTMAERGVSQLVSVDLEDAERFLEAV
jgi:chromosome segregation protein